MPNIVLARAGIDVMSQLFCANGCLHVFNNIFNILLVSVAAVIFYVLNRLLEIV